MIDLVGPLGRLRGLLRLEFKGNIIPCSLDLFPIPYLRHLIVHHYGAQSLELGGMTRSGRIKELELCNVSKMSLIAAGGYSNLRDVKVLYRTNVEDPSFYEDELRSKLREGLGGSRVLRLAVLRFYKEVLSEC